MATTEQIKHTENEIVAYFDKDHSNQKHTRDSQAVWFTVPAMAKIQQKLGITDESVNPVRAVLKVFKEAGINLEPVDLNRSRTALEQPKPELKADTGAKQSEILLKVARGETLNKEEMSLLSQKLSGSDSAKFEAEPVETKPAEKPEPNKELEALFAQFMAGALKK